LLIKKFEEPMMFWNKSKYSAPAEFAKTQAIRCRNAAALARQENDEGHAEILEQYAVQYDADALSCARADREKRARVIPYDYSW
jgi:hypothetical protein